MLGLRKCTKPIAKTMLNKCLTQLQWDSGFLFQVIKVDSRLQIEVAWKTLNTYTREPRDALTFSITVTDPKRYIKKDTFSLKGMTLNTFRYKLNASNWVKIVENYDVGADFGMLVTKCRCCRPEGQNHRKIWYFTSKYQKKEAYWALTAYNTLSLVQNQKLMTLFGHTKHLWWQ